MQGDVNTGKMLKNLAMGELEENDLWKDQKIILWQAYFKLS